MIATESICGPTVTLYHGSEKSTLAEEYEKKKNNKEAKYDPPYSAKQVKEKYGDKIFKRLQKDPAHKWRMDTGIELIHKEPTLSELLRIRKKIGI